MSMRWIFGAAFLLGGSLTIFAGDSPGEAKNIYSVLIQGILDGDSSVFQDIGTEEFRKQMTPELFQAAQSEIGNRLRAGFQSVYLGKISKSGREMYLWKVLISQSSEELLATLILDKNKVAGFYFQ